MNKNIINLLAVLILQSCFSASDNGKKTQSTPTNSRTPRDSRCVGNECAAISAEGLLPSMMYRKKGSKQFTFDRIQKYLKDKDLPSSLHLQAEENTDNDGEITTANHDHQNCGEEKRYIGVKARMNACAVKNSTTASWDGLVNGISGEGIWSLVMKDTTKSMELWLDRRTGLIWSQVLQANDWQRANGTKDVNSICKTLDTLSFKQINWRLPNRNEFLQADIDGARFVLPNTTRVFWTASSSDNPKYAWVINQATGSIQIEDKVNPYEIRCVGVAIK